MTGPRNLAELHERASRPDPGVLQAARTFDTDVLVIGAGGKMGFHLSLMLKRALAETGSSADVIAVSRFGSLAVRKQFDAHRIRTLPVDLTLPQALESLPASQNIFYLAGVKFGTRDNPALLRQMNVELPQRVATHFDQARIVALSTGCVYAFTTPQSGGSRESDVLDPPGEYARSCLGREQAFQNSATRTALIRLNYSVDLRYGVLVDVAQKVLAGQPVDVTTGFANVIWQGDANRYIVQALPKSAKPPFKINITGAKTLRIRDVALRFGELLDRPPVIVGQETETAWLSNASLAHQLWGPPSVDEDVLIEWVADWIRAGGETLNKPTHFESRDGNY